MKIIVQSNSFPIPAQLTRLSNVEGRSAKSLFILKYKFKYTKILLSYCFGQVLHCTVSCCSKKFMFLTPFLKCLMVTEVLTHLFSSPRAKIGQSSCKTSLNILQYLPAEFQLVNIKYYRVIHIDSGK